MNDKIIYEESKYKSMLKEKFGDQIMELDPVKRKFIHLIMVADMINSQYKIFSTNFRKEGETKDDVERALHLYMINLQHMDIIHDKINDLHEKYIKDSSIIDSFNDKTIMISWMNIIVMGMHMTQTILPLLNILKSQNISIDGDIEFAEHFKEFLSLMKWMVNMSTEFENYINKNMES